MSSVVVAIATCKSPKWCDDVFDQLQTMTSTHLRSQPRTSHLRAPSRTSACQKQQFGKLPKWPDKTVRRMAENVLIIMIAAKNALLSKAISAALKNKRLLLQLIPAHEARERKQFFSLFSFIPKRYSSELN